MPILVVCPKCQAQIQAPDTMAGQQGKCTRCATVVTVPAPPQPTAPAIAPSTAAPTAASPTPTAPVSSSPNTAAPNATSNKPRNNAATGSIATKAVNSNQPQSTGPKISADAAAQMAATQRGPNSVNAGWSTSPNATAVRPKQDSLQLQQQVLNAFQGPIEPIELDTSYEFGMVAALLVMLLLPLVYFGLIAFVLLIMYWYTLYFVSGLAAGGITFLVFSTMLYITATVFMVFMIKPIIASWGGASESREINPENEPLLFAFVQRICDTVGAPHPKQISVDCRVNASASFRQGIRSMLSDDDLTLTIGMPLVAGMTMQQFAGILAHEFGHFTQGAGMRTTYLIRYISRWFARVVYERDEWDDWLERMSRGDFKYLFVTAKGVVWLVRKPLWLLMMVGNAVTGFVLREMERDADRHEIRLAGSPAFRETTWRLNVLMGAHEWALADLGHFSRDGKLADDLPELIMANVPQLPKEMLVHLEKEMNERETSWFDSHPADRERIELATTEYAPGVFHLTQPARLLFNHYKPWCQHTTTDLYQQLFGPKFDPSNVYPVEELVETQQMESAQTKALRRYTQDVYSPLRVLKLPNWQISPPKNQEAFVARVEERRKQIQQHGVAMRKILDAYVTQDDQFVEAWQAASLLSAGYRLHQNDHAFSVRNQASAEAACSAAGQRMKQLGEQLESFETAFGERLWVALSLLHSPDVAKQIPDAKARAADAQRSLNALRIICQAHPTMLHVRNGLQRLNALCSQLDGKNRNELLFRAIGDTLQQTYDFLQRIHGECSVVDYPLDHSHGPMSLGQYLVKEMPPLEDINAVYDTADRAMDRFVNTYVRIMARLATLGEHIESAFAMSPLPNVPERKK